jgi:hypothetical protein
MNTKPIIQPESLIKISSALAEEQLQGQKTVTGLSGRGHTEVMKLNICTKKNGGLVFRAKGIKYNVEEKGSRTVCGQYNEWLH